MENVFNFNVIKGRKYLFGGSFFFFPFPFLFFSLESFMVETTSTGFIGSKTTWQSGPLGWPVPAPAVCATMKE